MPRYTTRIRYPTDEHPHATFDVLTPDGGMIQCRNEAAAERVATDMNALCAYIEDAADSPERDRIIDDLLNAWWLT